MHEHQREVKEETEADDKADGRIDDLPHPHVLHAKLSCNRVENLREEEHAHGESANLSLHVAA